MAVTYTEARDVNERLKPLRRMLEDIGTAVEFMAQVEEKKRVEPAQIKKLTEEREKLQAQVEKARFDHKRLMDEQETSTRQAAEMGQRQQRELNGKISALRQRLAEMEDGHKSRVEAMEREYQGKLSALQSEVGDAEKRRDVALAELEAYKQRMARI